MYLFKRNGIYYVEYFDLSTETIRRISTKSRSKGDALKFLAGFKQQQKSQPKTEPISLNRFKYEYLDYIERTKTSKYLISVKLTFKMLVNYLGRDIPLANIKLRDYEKFFIERYHQATYAALLYHRNLKAALNKAIEWGYLQDNPVRKIKLPRGKKSFPVFITKEDLDKIVQNAATPMLGNIFLFAFHTGMRQSEILNLKWKSVNLKDRVITVQNHETFMTKSKRERVIPINNNLHELLTSLSCKEADGYVFTDCKGIKFNNDNIAHKFKKAVRAAGVNERIRFHDLRHGFASSLVQRGVSLYVVKELLGHGDISTTQIYAHLQAQNLIDAVKKLDD